MKTKTLAAQLLAASVLMVTLTSAWANEPAQAVTFPELKNSWLKTGDFTGPDHIRRINIGMNKDQVALQIGNPHFNEGVGGPNVWNYAFNFYTGNGADYITCQYQVRFDKQHTRVESTHWKEKQCEAFMAEKRPEVKQPLHSISLAADGMFEFGKSGYADVLPAGRQKLERLAGQIKGGYNLTSLKITGHTDRIGSVRGNLALSQARAETVKNYLVSQGIDGSMISAVGVGSSQPIVTCSGATTPAVIACLQPNRRVDIAVSGTVKQ